MAFHFLFILTGILTNTIYCNATIFGSQLQKNRNLVIDSNYCQEILQNGWSRMNLKNSNVPHSLLCRSTQSHCLDNEPAVAGPTQSPSLYGKLPGEVFNADKQCEMIFGAGKKQCATKKVRRCQYRIQFQNLNTHTS